MFKNYYRKGEIMKEKTVFICTECGNEAPKWSGKCPACGAWNTMIEETIKVQGAGKQRGLSAKTAEIKTLEEIKTDDEERISTHVGELDRVLGGGIVKGSLVLVGGDPGIGKSTILLQMCQTLGGDEKILYVSGEESPRQLKLRAQRLNVTNPRLRVLSETSMEVITDCVYREKPDILIIDSVQTMYNPQINSVAGNAVQIRDAAVSFMKIAKEEGIAVFLVGHVTKDGSIAGPKILEHIVDTVLYFEGERRQVYRILRAVKNRFGSTNEIGVFEMREGGLAEVPNPSQAMLSGRPADTPGSCIICTMEGTRPVLAEVQALVSPTNFGNPRRMTNGIDLSRALMLTAVLEKRAGLHISAYDAYINIVGGLRINEPAVDLGVILALASSFRNTAIDSGAVAIGEVGLAGELRSCNFLEARIAEAEKLGFTKCIVPSINLKKLKPFEKIEVCGFADIRGAIDDFVQ